MKAETLAFLVQVARGEIVSKSGGTVGTPGTSSSVPAQKCPLFHVFPPFQLKHDESGKAQFGVGTPVGTRLRDDFDVAERAAIVEFDGGAPREWAEGFARLDRARPPDDVPQRRWLQFIDDCGTFLDGDWAATAQALGWDAANLFGCDRDRPFARVDRMGLLWLLNGRRVVALTADAAIIEAPNGSRLIYRRAPSYAGQVLAWELNSAEEKTDGC
jgi:hypothetical protein